MRSHLQNFVKFDYCNFIEDWYIYVNNTELGAPGGSSFSVPELSVQIDVLLKKGLSKEEAKAKILASSDIHQKTLADETQVTLRVFNPQLLETK